jgi:hypothetical protein
MSILEHKSGLATIESFPFPVFASLGYEDQASIVAARCYRAFEHLGGLFSVSPEFHLKALNQADWDSHTTYPTFGMPHYTFYTRSLTVAVEPGEFWTSFVELIRNSSADAYDELESVYGRIGDEINVSKFFDLLVVHELAHAVHHQGKCEFSRKWIKELFCNLCLHDYIASIEPQELPVLEAFPRLMAEVDPSDFQYQSLEDLEAIYDNMPPQNYGWYQTQLHVAAKRVYEAGGKLVLKRLWEAFHTPDALIEQKLRERVDSSVADIMTAWPVVRPG